MNRTASMGSWVGPAVMRMDCAEATRGSWVEGDVHGLFKRRTLWALTGPEEKSRRTDEPTRDGGPLHWTFHVGEKNQDA